MFFRRLKEAVRTLASKDTILNIPVDGIIKLAGEANIKNFVQIGSNDGVKNDPFYHYIRRNGWKGILVEPEKANFNKLKTNYSQSNDLIFENLGIGSERGELLFYKLKDILASEPGWYDQIGSFDQRTFLKNIEFEKGLDKRMTAEPIQVITFDDLIQKHTFGEVDLLHTDTEGFDYKILRSIDLDKHHFKILFFEAEWMTLFELKEIIQHLRSYKYHIFRSGIDYAAVKMKNTK